ncbi:hypothetical protein MIR68_006043 [Amoeboaphelidium protococcarum]|nr:hypothetical protein MIR68_006043 [Amoeboaphelidium protococcarum]
MNDIDRVKYLVEMENAPINDKDMFSASPLYYAVLCGHLQIVHYFLDSGAVKIEPNSFDAERLYYGALNNKIRNLLRDYNFSKSFENSNQFVSVMSRLFFDQKLTDLTFVVKGAGGSVQSEYKVHKCILRWRSCYFNDILNGRFKDRSSITISHPSALPLVVQSVLFWLYTGTITVSKLDRFELECLEIVIKAWKLTALEKQLLDIGKSQNRKQLVKISDYSQQVQDDIQRNYIIPIASDQALQNLPDQDLMHRFHADIILNIGQLRIPAHKAILMMGSDFFNDLLDYGVGDSACQSIKLNEPAGYIDESTVMSVLEFIYCGRLKIKVDRVSTAFKILIVADFFLMDGLRSLAALSLCVALSNVIKPSDFSADQNTTLSVMDVSIWEIIKVSLQLNLDRVEQKCIQYIAKHFDQILKDGYERNELKTLIIQSASSIKARQETDSVPFIDDLRFYFTSHDSLLDKLSQNNYDRKVTVEDDDQDPFFESQIGDQRHMLLLDELLLECNLDI